MLLHFYALQVESIQRTAATSALLALGHLVVTPSRAFLAVPGTAAPRALGMQTTVHQ